MSGFLEKFINSILGKKMISVNLFWKLLFVDVWLFFVLKNKGLLFVIFKLI